MSGEGESPANDRFHASLQLYGWLRDEIDQSNHLQHRIVIGLATVVGIVFGLLFGAKSGGFSLNTSTMAFLAAGVLPVTVGATGLWLVEQSRVMQAGNYLQLVERKLHDEVGSAPVSWEHWLRRDELNAEHFNVQEIYNKGYLFGYIGFFVTVGVLAFALFVDQVLNETVSLTSGTITLNFVQKPVAWIYLLSFSVLLIVMFIYAFRIVRHSDHSPDTEILDGALDDFERNYFEPRIFLRDAFEEFDSRIEDLDLNADDYLDQFDEMLELAERHVRNQQGT